MCILEIRLSTPKTDVERQEVRELWNDLVKIVEDHPVVFDNTFVAVYLKVRRQTIRFKDEVLKKNHKLLRSNR